ncbi:GNAT family N-acetyltransferase [Nocardioides sp. LHG3406-4]|uniref:GNAT family N-acetyltransferase n=1 Tax=Nocardioides sp. LHG3406-4 TaxID=2804575 RepID=UPI003CF13ACB
MVRTNDSISVIINPISAQFEAIQCSEAVGVLAYQRAGTHFNLRHTFVSRKHRGRGIAGVLVPGALAAIRSSGGTITPSCAYVSAFVSERPEYEDLIDPEPFRSPARSAAVPPTLDAITDRSIVDVVDVQIDRIISNRIVLRPWTLDDTDSALSIYQDPGVIRWTRPFIRPVTDGNSMRRRLDAWMSQSNRLPHPHGRWAIELADSGALIGGAALLNPKLDGQELLAMSWELAPSAVGHGLAAEAGHALIHYAFRVSAATTVHAVVHIENQRAIATLQRAGMVQLPGARTHRGAEVFLYGITRDDLDSVQLAARSA